MKINSFLTLLLCMCLMLPAKAQQYAAGNTDIQTPHGTVRVNSGYVSHFNAHSFQVYAFQYHPNITEATWNQLPLLPSNDAAPTEFLVKVTATADFPLRDARIVAGSKEVALYVAELKFKDTPYDDDSVVELRRYVLKQQANEERWAWILDSARMLPRGIGVSQALTKLPNQ